MQLANLHNHAVLSMAVITLARGHRLTHEYLQVYSQDVRFHNVASKPLAKYFQAQNVTRHCQQQKPGTGEARGAWLWFKTRFAATGHDKLKVASQ